MAARHVWQEKWSWAIITTMIKDLQNLLVDIDKSPHDTDVVLRLRTMGFDISKRTAETLGKIVTLHNSVTSSAAGLSILINDFLQSPNAGAGLVNLLRYVESTGPSSAFITTVSEGKPIRDILVTLFCSSQYMADIVIRNPGYLYWLIEQRTWDENDTVEMLIAQLKSETDNFESTESKLNAAKRFQRKMLLKIGTKDLMGAHSVEESTKNLSDLADALAAMVLESQWGDCCRATADLPTDGFSVIALGKLGGRELNYSSDVDLLYVCKDVDDRVLAHYDKLAQKFSRRLGDLTVEGRFYRVDLRLRPDGKVGPLVNTLTTMLLYYENRGRPWEFQAMLKARVIAGDHTLGSEFLSRISQLIINPSLSYSPVDTIALMRKRIQDNISARDRVFNIKLMEGGIRDIEFVVQTLQLMYALKHPALRTTNTVEGIHRAFEQDLLNKAERDTLVDAYRFFRLVEHRLQMMHQLQTHSIPESPDDLRLLADRVSRGPLGSYSKKKFVSALAAHLNKVRVLSDSFFSGEKTSDVSMLLLSPEGDETAERILTKYGIVDTEQALPIVLSLAYGSFPDLVDRNTRASFQNLLPNLLEEGSRTGDPAGTLVNFSKIATAIRSRRSLYDFLVDSPSARNVIRDLTGTSSLLTNMLCGSPEIIDTLFEDPHHLVQTPKVNEIPWPSATSDPSEQASVNLSKTLRKGLDRRLVGAWTLDTRGRCFPNIVSETLTATAREWITTLLERLVPDDERVVMLALGSYAIAEPGLHSDIDLIVATDGGNIEQITAWTQRVNQTFLEGPTFKLDFRLRGEGENAPLIQDVASYKKYFATRMSEWEKVAFGKCVLWSGDQEIGDEFTDALQNQLSRPFEKDEAEQLMQTRQKIEGLVSTSNEFFDTKRSSGGRYDIDYLCALALSRMTTPFPFRAGTIERIGQLADAGVITDEEDRQLREAFELFRRIDYLIDLQGWPLPNNERKRAELIRYLDRTSDLLGFPITGGIEKRLPTAKGHVRHVYKKVFGV